MTEKNIICITCPVGCNIIVRGEGDNIAYLDGNQCKRGSEYARSEFIHPVRILTTTVKVEKSRNPLIPVRSNKPVPKELLLQCMEVIKNITVNAPVSRYDVIIPDILGTGVDICATGTVQEDN